MSLIQLIDCFQDYYKQWKKADGTYLSQEISSYLHGHSGALTIDKIFLQMDEKQIVIYNYTERNFDVFDRWSREWERVIILCSSTITFLKHI